jgi:hypothetical protein
MEAYDAARSAPFEICWRIEDYEDPEAGVWFFRYSCPADEVEETLRRAIQEFVNTEESILLVTSNRGFNWGDAVNHIPEEWWNQYGLSCPPQPTSCFRIQVDHDESFAEYLGRG